MINNVTVWLDETARRYPDKIAYCDKEKQLTFRQIKIRSLSLAKAITEMLGGRSKCPIAIYMEKSVDLLISFFAVAYSGNFYSPIDANMPLERIQKILSVLEPKIIIHHQGQSGAFESSAKRLCFDDYFAESGEVYDDVYRIRSRTIDTDLLYVLFTSGSTGMPKGVTITHRSVIDYIDCIVDSFKLDSDDVYGNQAPFYFDNSILDIYCTLKTGATMYIIPENMFSWPMDIIKYIEKNRINTIFWVPSALVLLSQLHAIEKCDLRGVLKRVMFCGEVMPTKHLNVWRKCLPDTMFVNIYGPTEITDACTYYIVDREFSDDEPLPIGTPMHNTDIIVLNDKDEPVLGDEIGELCVRGTSISMGYYRNSEKTKEVFVQNPLNSLYPELIYRTGDLVRYNEFGELMYLSRKDYQIKHMGHRIELGEIETAVSAINDVSLSCCLYDEKKKRIVLFTEGDYDLSYIKNHISKQIPEYMMPARIVCLKKMPINANGKIDRKILKEQYF